MTGFTSNAPEGVTVALKDGKKAEAKGTDAGTYKMNLTADDFTATSKNYTRIEIEVEDGALKITPTDEVLKVKVTGNKETKEYTGSEQKVTGFTSNAPEGVTVALREGKEAVAKGTTVGHYEMGLVAEDFNVTSKNYSNIKVVVEDGYLDITPIEEKLTVTITGNHDSKVYNGNEQSITGYKHDAPTNVSVALKGDKTAVAKGTTVGEYPMGLTEKDFTVTSANYSNIEIVVVDGYLKITPISTPITITAASNDKKYDGTPLTEDGYSYTKDVLLNGDVLEAVVEGTITEFGEADNEVKSYKVMRGEVDVTDSYTFTESQKGKLKINKRSVVLTSASDRKKYDGEPLTRNEQTDITVSGDGFVEKEGAIYTITGSQLRVGSSNNEFTYELKDNTKASNYDIRTEVGTLTVTDGIGTDPVDPDKVVVKKHENREYSLGETVEFTITVTNIYDKVQTITIKEKEGVTITGPSKFEDVEPGEQRTTTATYKISEKDILAGSFMNTVEASFTEKTFENEDKVETNDPAGHLTVIKEATSTPANGTAYALDEAITYSVYVTNDGNVTLTDVVVTDPLTKTEWNVGTLEPGESSEKETTSYTVAEADILKSNVVNEATATGNPPKEGIPVTATPGIVDKPTMKSAPSLHVEKEAVHKEGGYKVGDVVPFTIKVTNNGNVTLNNVEVVDELTGDTIKVGNLAPNTSNEQAINVEYTVTEADVLSGNVTNVATATGTDPDGKEVKGEGTKEVTTESVSRSLDITKTVINAPANGTAYQVGESINYEVAVKNTGNVTLKNVQVTDQMQGAAGNAELRAGENATIAELAPEQTVTLHYAYTVRAADLGATFRNTATAVAPGPDNGDDPTEDTDTTPGEPVVPPTPGPGPDDDPDDDPDDNPVITPAGNPAAPAGPAAVITAVAGAPAPVADAIGDALEGAAAAVRELTDAGDEEVPLANTNLENEHKCCIFHFLVMLISMIVLAFFTRSMKKRQEKIFELREELDTELAKRGLPLSNEKQ